MTIRRWLAAGVLVLVAALGGYAGWRALGDQTTATGPVAASQPVPLDANAAAGTIETVASTDDALPTGGTPMADRVAVIGLLNKRNGVSRDLTLKPGQAVRVGDVIVRLRACEKTAPYEQDQLTGAFAQVDVRGVDQHWRRVFSGWLFKERPALNVVEHPVYDVWTKSCTMSWPATGPDTTALSDGSPQSSAKKSAPEAGDSEEAAPTTPAIAVESNAT